MTDKPIQNIGLVGFGEVGEIFGRDFTAHGRNVFAYDILFHSHEARESMMARAWDAGVHAKGNLQECLRDAELVISAVTASSAVDVARDAAPMLRSGQIYLDINSVSPGTKAAMAARIDREQGCFVEAAVMAAVAPKRLKVPMLLGGTQAARTAEQLDAIGMDATAVSERIGVASATKMCRSVMMKGIEALAVESLMAARRYGAEDGVLASLAATYPEMGWDRQLPDYLIGRVAQHGRRRAAEMREAAQTLRDVGINPMLALATVERQDWLVREIAEHAPGTRTLKPFSWRKLMDAISGAEKPTTEPR